MQEASRFVPIASRDVYEDTIGYVTLYDISGSNTSEEQRIWTVTSIASLAYGNTLAKAPEALYNRLRTIKHESLWEFITNTGTLKDTMRNSPEAYQNKYLDEDGVAIHSSNVACFKLKVPIFVARQFMRHRSFAYLELSRRYTKEAKVPFEFWCPKGHSPAYDPAFLTAMVQQSGFPAEVSSRFLPQVTYTTFYMLGGVESLRNFFNLRLQMDAQKEIRQVALAMLSLLQEFQPKLHNKIQQKDVYVTN